jgi:uncharacterized membrane protein
MVLALIDILVTGIINWFHVVSVIGWTGAVVTFIVSLQPSLAKFSPQANGEFVVKVLPRLVRSIQLFAVFTLIFGPLLAFTMNDGEPNVFNFVSPWSVFITIGAALGITMLLMVFFFLTPTASRLVRVVSALQKNPQKPSPAELKVLGKRMAIGTPLSLALLLLTEVFMVGAAQF